MSKSKKAGLEWVYALWEKAQALKTDGAVDVRLRQHTLDALATWVAGLHHPLAHLWGDPLHIEREMWPLGAAAAVHAYEWDDTFVPGSLHLSACTMPLVWRAWCRPQSQLATTPKEALIVSWLFGARVALVLRDHLDWGWYPTGVVGPMIAGLLQASLHRDPGEAWDRAVRAASLTVVGNREALVAGLATKAILPALAVRAGLDAASWCGEAHPWPHWMGGRFDLVHAASHGRIATIDFSDLTWPMLHLRQIPACGLAQRYISAARSLRGLVEAQSLTAVYIRLTPREMALIGNPALGGETGSLFNVARLVAATLLGARVVVPPNWHQLEASPLLERCHLQCTAVPEESGVVAVEDGAGHRWEARRGVDGCETYSPQLSWEAVRQKFGQALSSWGISDSRAADYAAIVERQPELWDQGAFADLVFRPLVAALQVARRRRR